MFRHPGGAIYIEGVEEAVNGLVTLYRERNKFIDAEATAARALPMLIERTNRRLHPHGLHLVLEKGRALLLHRADGKTRGTNKQKAQRAEKAVKAELNELATAFLDTAR